MMNNDVVLDITYLADFAANILSIYVKYPDYIFVIYLLIITVIIILVSSVEVWREELFVACPW